VELLADAPPSGMYKLGDRGGVAYSFFDYRRSAVETESDGFFLRITGPGDWRYEGADLGILITRGRLMGDDGELNSRAHAWLRGLSDRYRAMPTEVVAPAVALPGTWVPETWAPPAPAAGAFKIL
jgi:hypothetical protein